VAPVPPLATAIVPTFNVMLPESAPPPVSPVPAVTVRVVGTPPRFERAVEAIVAPVPPLATATGEERAIVPLPVMVPPVNPVPAVMDVTVPVAAVVCVVPSGYRMPPVVLCMTPATESG